MKQLLTTTILVLFYALSYAQDSFSNISFDGPKRYVPKVEGAVPTDVEFRRMKEEIRTFPSRLDYRYVYMDQLTKAKDWRRLTTEAIALIDYSYDTNHRWKWYKQYWPSSEEAEAFLLSTIQDYVLMLYLEGEPVHYHHIRSISKAVTKHRPDHVDFLTYPAMTYTDVKDYDNAIIHLKQAELVAPDDATVNFLLAEHFEQTGDRNMSISYYSRVLKFGDERSQNQAKQRIQKLDTE